MTKPKGSLVHSRGTSNKNVRGSSYDVRRRKQWLLDTYGNGTYVYCYNCPTVLVFETVTVDRIMPGILGGTYCRDNIRPCCSACNIKTGNELQLFLARITLNSLTKGHFVWQCWASRASSPSHEGKIEHMAAKRSLKDHIEKRVASAYAKGKTTSELAEQHGVSADTIRAAVVRQGGTLRPRGGIAGKAKTKVSA